jgi:rhodanese-related sulfurtransferase
MTKSTRSAEKTRARHERQAAQRALTRRLLVVALAAAVAVVAAVAFWPGSGDDTNGDQGADVTTAAAAVTLVSPQQADALIAENAGNSAFTILDVRTAEEFATGHITGAVNLDVQDPSFGASLAALDPAATYLVYCHSGNRSATATAQMEAAGFGDVHELDGGVTAWSAAGLPLE